MAKKKTAGCFNRKKPAPKKPSEALKREALTRTSTLIEELSKRFKVKYEVAANEILGSLIGFMSEVGEDYGIKAQPIKAVVNLYGIPEENTPHLFAENDNPAPDEDPTVCIFCEKPKGDPLHVSLPPELRGDPAS